MDTIGDRIPVILLPGIFLPARLRYVPLLNELGDSVQAVVKELEVYAEDAPPADYSIAMEIEGINRAAGEAGFERFHLYGHSAGGACALAYAATYPERLLSLALDEPASDFSPQARAEMHSFIEQVQSLPEDERLPIFLQWQLAPGVELPAPPEGPTPDWMSKRPAGVKAFTGALLGYSLQAEKLRSVRVPVYYSYGELSNPTWQGMRDRLAAAIPDFTAELYEGLHHLNTSHQSEPARVAAALRRLWSRAASETPGGVPA